MKILGHINIFSSFMRDNYLSDETYLKRCRLPSVFIIPNYFKDLKWIKNQNIKVLMRNSQILKIPPYATYLLLMFVISKSYLIFHLHSKCNENTKNFTNIESVMIILRCWLWKLFSKSNILVQKAFSRRFLPENVVLKT